MNINNGVQNTGDGSITIGNHNRIGGSPGRENAPPPRTDIGVITVLSTEAGAVVGALDDVRTVRADGVRFHRGQVGDASVVMARTERQGNRSTGMPFQLLRTHFAPGVIVLVGIGGGIHRDVQPGDVVIGEEVVYYDRRKETASGVRRRSEGHQIPAWVRREVNDFFTDHGEPFVLPCGKAKVLAGPVGSGEAVVADASSPIRRHLASVNDKTLALDMEAGGLALDFHTQTGQPRARGWLVIRGISDNADEEKDDTCHQVAAKNAATVLRMLIPCLAEGLRHQV
ncbi:5'-methylthioadenosine/S-adenosylhomocysteine nucleosidase [Spirillospora sp. NPDC049652]